MTEPYEDLYREVEKPTEPLSPERLAEIRAKDAEYGVLIEREETTIASILYGRRQLLAEVDRLTRENAELRAKVAQPDLCRHGRTRCACLPNYGKPEEGR